MFTRMRHSGRRRGREKVRKTTFWRGLGRRREKREGLQVWRLGTPATSEEGRGETVDQTQRGMRKRDRLSE